MIDIVGFYMNDEMVGAFSKRSFNVVFHCAKNEVFFSLHILNLRPRERSDTELTGIILFWHFPYISHLPDCLPNQLFAFCFYFVDLHIYLADFVTEFSFSLVVAVGVVSSIILRIVRLILFVFAVFRWCSSISVLLLYSFDLSTWLFQWVDSFGLPSWLLFLECSILIFSEKVIFGWCELTPRSLSIVIYFYFLSVFMKEFSSSWREIWNFNFLISYLFVLFLFFI